MRGVLLHAILAVAGLVFAYQTWTREEQEERPAGEVTVVECSADTLTRLHIDTPTSTVTVEPEKDGDATHYWITAQRKKAEEKPEGTKDKAAKGEEDPHAALQRPDAGVKPAPEKASAEKPSEATPTDKPEETKPPIDETLYAPRRFLANAKFKEYLALVTPLRLARGLGEVPENKFEEFGFDKVGTFLHVECGGKKVKFDVGGRTYGSGMQYLRDPQSRQAYLADAALARDLESAQFKFMQVEPHGFALADIDEAVVHAQGAERRLLQRNRQVKSEARWVNKAEPDRRDETFGNWFGHLERLRVTSYLPRNAEPGSDLKAAGKVTPAVSVDYFTGGQPKGRLELVRVESEGKGTYYARTETTGVWTRVYDSVGKQVEDDAALVVGIEPPANESTTPAAAAPPTGGPAPGTPAAASRAPTPGSPPSTGTAPTRGTMPAATRPPAHPAASAPAPTPAKATSAAR